MKISQNGVDFIKSFEGLRLVAYKAVPTERYYTIGYGHYGADVSKGKRITEKEAEDLFKKDLQKYVDGVNGCINVNVSQNQFDAMVSLCYNIGITGFATSTLVKKINKGDYQGASDEFLKWNKSGGKVLNGLVKRRQKERELFLMKTDVYFYTGGYGGDSLKKFHTFLLENNWYYTVSVNKDKYLMFNVGGFEEKTSSYEKMKKFLTENNYWYEIR